MTACARGARNWQVLSLECLHVFSSTIETLHRRQTP
jgi:hypothetical protein